MQSPDTKHVLDRSMIGIVTNGYVESNSIIYKVSQVIDFHEVIGIDIETNQAKRLLIDTLKPVEGSDSIDNGFIHRDLTDISDENWKIMEKKFLAIKPLLDGATRAEKEEHAKTLGVHVTTLYRWLKHYKSTGTLTGLIPRKEGRKEGETRIESRAESIIQKMIQEHFLTRQKPTVQFVINRVLFECHKENITPPSANTIRRRISKITEYERLKRQGNKSIAETKFGPAAGKYKADYPLQVVQIDHTQADIILVDDETRQTIGRPWITLMIDIYSRMITGYYISLDAPSITSDAMCIANAVCPKDAWLFQKGIDAEWNVWGFAQTIHADNGADFQSDTIQKSCAVYGMHIYYRPIRKTRYGGHIERLIGTVMKTVHSIPGTTFSNIRERQTYDSDGHACMTFSEFDKWVVTFITKVYHKRKHGTLGVSPEYKWKEGIFGGVNQDGIGYPPKPSDSQTIMIDFLPMFTRTIQKNGVNIDGLNYYDHVLRHLINRVDNNTKRKEKHIFRRDPRDISYLWFYDVVTQAYYKVSLADQSLPNMSLWEYNKIKERLKERGSTTNTHHEILAAYDELHQQVLDASKKTKKARRQLQKVKMQKLRQDNKPEGSNIEKQSYKNSVVDESLWDDDIPEFD